MILEIEYATHSSNRTLNKAIYSPVVKPELIIHEVFECGCQEATYMHHTKIMVKTLPADRILAVHISLIY